MASLASACGGGGNGGSKLQVVAAENFWGSIASQIAGSKATVQSIIVNPSTDPHDYEPTASDARTMAGARLAIVNGLGYDGWASRLLAANPDDRRAVLNIGDALGLPDGANPHRWYSPASLEEVILEITDQLSVLDPADAAYFTARRQAFETKSLKRYTELRLEIRNRFADVPVGYSESIFEPLGRDLGLSLLTPPGFARAIAEGTDVSASDKAVVDEQVTSHQIKVWIFNSQNVTPDVQRVNALAKAAHVPIATITETLSPATDTFQDWQVAQLEGLIAALHQATGD